MLSLWHPEIKKHIIISLRLVPGQGIACGTSQLESSSRVRLVGEGERVREVEAV